MNHYDCGDSHCPVCNPTNEWSKCPNCGFFHSAEEECPTQEELE